MTRDARPAPGARAGRSGRFAPIRRLARGATVVATVAASLLGLAGPRLAGAQEGQRRPPYKLLRAEEDYAFLRDGPAAEPDLWDPIKFIPLDRGRSIFLTLGGEIRPRVEFFGNRAWITGRDSYYSQRLALHAAANLGGHVRLFGELYHGLLTQGEKAVTQDDKLDLHQGFVEVDLPLARRHQLRFRLGRQELAYGAARLVGIREGPNIRRAFDGGRVTYGGPGLSIDAVLGGEVTPLFEVFDNRRNRSMLFWGVFSSLSLLPGPGTTEIYYFGIDLDEARYNDGIAPETRHTFGVRRFGVIGRSFRYNTEVMLQVGTFGDKRIAAFAVETDYYYRFAGVRFRPELGIKLDYVSGDREHGDNRLNTFNPLFPNPAYFGLLGQITPMNLFDVHPSIALELADQVDVVADWDVFWRASTQDGLYAPPRFLAREGQNVAPRFIGHQPSFELQYRIDRHATWSFEASYFVSGSFIQASGDAPNILHLASSLAYKF